MNKEKAIQLATDTLEILHNGEYTNGNGAVVDIRKSLNNAILRSILFQPDDTEQILNQWKTDAVPTSVNTDIEVTQETTLEACRRLVSEGHRDVAALNFASAKNPGGGFQTGSQAQEESLARSSGLYPCIAQMDEMYAYNRQLKSALYSDYMIFSPNVPVFRNDAGKLLDEPYEVSFVTAPAVNAGVVRKQEKEHMYLVSRTMDQRIEKILTVAMAHQQKVLVLGAFGCGVFQNSVDDIAILFRNKLKEFPFRNRFEKVVFAIYEKPPQTVMFRRFQGILRSVH